MICNRTPYNPKKESCVLTIRMEINIEKQCLWVHVELKRV